MVSHLILNQKGQRNSEQEKVMEKEVGSVDD